MAAPAPSPARAPRTIIVGDIHGCVDELSFLVERLCGADAARDRVVSVGDLVGKGPDSLGVVRYCRTTGVLTIRGECRGVVVEVGVRRGRRGYRGRECGVRHDPPGWSRCREPRRRPPALLPRAGRRGTPHQRALSPVARDRRGGPSVPRGHAHVGPLRVRPGLRGDASRRLPGPRGLPAGGGRCRQRCERG